MFKFYCLNNLYCLNFISFRSIQIGIVSSKRNLRYVLMKELGVDKSDLLMRHQHWKTAAFVDIARMLKYLKKHFTVNEICPNIHIVLYEQ